ncbi:MFS transporter [Streptomyces sp. NPDC026206]|uniref:MFS transporter n=1 Tax=Streptomyces sp. NPDC026206 TaxID=3157089 RepID=UPI0033D8B760
MSGALAIAAPMAAVPVTSRALHMGPGQAQWFAAGYQLSAGALHLGAGRLADRIGPRRVLLAAVTVFGAGSLLAATAVSASCLIFARLLQGSGGSALSPVSLALLLNLRRDSGNEARAVAGWVSTAAFASCLGPLLGGCLASTLGWRGIFGALAVLAAVTVCCSLGLPADVRRTRCDPHPSPGPGLLRRAPARRALCGLLILFTANSAFHFLSYCYLSHTHSLTPFQAALAASPATLPAVLTGRPAAARAALGQGPTLIRAGLLCIAAGLLVAATGYRHPTPLWLLSCACSLVGCGLGLANGAAMTTVVLHSTEHHTSRATAMATTFAMLGGALGPVLAGTALSATRGLSFAHGPPQMPGVHTALSLIALVTAMAAFARW